MQYHHGDLKNALIQAGLELLKNEGPKGFSLRKAAKKAGVSHSAPYSHFRNKDDLIAAIAIEGFKRLIAHLTEEPRFTAPREKKDFFDLAWQYMKFALDNPDYYTVMFSQAIHPSEHEGLGGTSIEALRILLNAVGAAQKGGILKKENPFLTALTIWSSLHGICSLLISNYIPEENHIAAAPLTPMGKTEHVLDREKAHGLCEFCMNQIYLGIKA